MLMNSPIKQSMLPQCLHLHPHLRLSASPIHLHQAMLMTSDLLPQATALVLGIPYRTRGTLMA
ncbi:hypothetical protein NC652_013831 [Populus alba x Populus x berolinensis]|uniref:Uncharacterized protein n=1 Tax=Populus alba x Populus x berolinensis TaxID=444605 RepID=A0AAD6QWC1_9ROSI|nr:hypothetical protein NC652_013831 [Populus alba x Populus x berolinensis]KAJ6997342.1 hypothetical protein NC653_013801 [Populus alba x Populus x berolinensis]